MSESEGNNRRSDTEVSLSVADDAATAESRTGRRGDSLASAVVLMLVLTVLQRGAGFFRNVVVCRFLEPTDLGLWNLAQSFLILAAPLVVLGIPGAFKRYVAHYQHRDQLEPFLRRALAATALLTLLGIGGLLVTSRQVAWLAFGDVQLAWFAIHVIGTLAVIIAFNVVVELMTSLRLVKAVSRMQLLNSLLFTALAVILLAVTNLRALGVVYAYAAACAGSLLWALRDLAQMRKSEPQASLGKCPPGMWARLLPFAGWLWLSDLLTNLFGVIDRFMIVHWADGFGWNGMEIVGQYHSSQIMGVLLVAMTSMLAGVLLSYLSHDWETGQREKAEQALDASLRQMGVVLTAASALAMLVAPWIFDVVLSRRYGAGLQALPVTMAYCIWFGLIGVAQNYLWCREAARLVCLPLVAGILLNLVLNALWMPSFGLLGVVAATAGANLVTLVLVMGICHGMGLRYHFSTWVSLALPACLCWGGWQGLIAVVVYAVWGFASGWMLTPPQWELLDSQRDRILDRLARMARPSRWWRRNALGISFTGRKQQI